MSLQLEPRHERFCQEYDATLNATRAALAAGYAPKRAQQAGAALLKRWHIQQRIDELRAARAVKTQITAERIEHELAKIGFANLGDYVRINDDGHPEIDLSKVTREQLAAIAEVQEQTTRADTKHGESVTVNRKLKLIDKKAALELLGKRRGMFVERHEHTGADGAPLIPQVSAREAARRIAFALALGLRAQANEKQEKVA